MPAQPLNALPDAALPDAALPNESDQYRTEIEKLFVEFEAQVYRCVHRGLSPRDTEQVASAAFLALVPHWAEVREHRSPIMYVMRTALNLRADLRRRASVRRAQGLADLDENRRHAPRPESDQLDLSGALARLNLREEQLTVMRYWMDLDPDEIAQVWGLNDGQVRKTLLDARVKLAELLMDDPADGDGDQE